MPPHLKLTSTLHGRQEELNALETAYSKCINKAGQLIVLTGSGGSGKSSLICSFADNTESSFFCAGKFCMHRREPYSAVVDTIYALCCDSLGTTEEGRQELADALEKVSLDESILRTVLPKLYQTSNKDKDITTPSLSSSDAKKENNVTRLYSALFNLFRSICKPTRPVILFLDDVHWADQASVALVSCLVSNLAELKGLLLVIAYREDEVDDSLSLRLNEMRSRDGVACIEVSSLNVQATNTFLAETLGQDAAQTLPLAQVLHQKTGGNPFYLRKILQSLERNGHLYFSSYKWEWDDVRRLSLELGVSDNVVELIVSTMEELPNETQEALKVASCLGGQFRTSVIAEYFRRYPCEYEANAENDTEEKTNCSLLSMTTEEQVDKVLEVALEEELLTRRTSSSTYLWSHDRLHQAAYSLVEDGNDRATMHLRLGTLLKDMLETHQDQQWVLFLAADQLNHGSSLITAQDSRLELARLNLEAAQVSSSKSAYFPAANLLRKGVSFIDPSLRWTDTTYDLCLELYTALAEIEFVLGNHAASRLAVDEVTLNAKCAADKFQVQRVLIESLGAQRRYDEAMTANCDALKSYGVRLPKSPSRVHVRLEAFLMKRQYEKIGLEGIMELDKMTDPAAIRQASLLNLLSFYSSVSGRINTFAVAALRCIRLSFTKGMSGMLPAVLGGYSMFLGMSGKTEEAYKYCDIAVKLYAAFGDRHFHARVITGLQSAVMPLKHSFHETLEPNLEAYQIGIACGDLEYGMIGALLYAVSYLLAGLPLAPIGRDLSSFLDQAKSYQLPQTLQVTFEMQLQVVLNLQGHAVEGPTLLIGEAMDERTAMEGFEERSLWSVKRDLFTARIQLAYIFGDLEVGKEMIEELKAYPTDLVVARKYLRDSYTALVAFAVAARSKREKKYLRHGQKLLKEFQSQAKQGSVNAYPIYLFLLAEDGAINEDGKDANGVKLLYDEAIKTCARSGLLHLAAMANERAGQYFLEKKDESTSSFYLSRALDLYDDWGAIGKVNHMKQHYDSSLLKDSKGSHKSASLKARERFTEENSLRLKTFDLDPN